MRNFNPHLVIDEVKNLISYSISNPEVDKLKFEQLHIAIVKKYFNAKNIHINYIDQTIDLKLPVSNDQYNSINFECLNLSQFLQSCLKSDDESIHFYQNLLNRYDIVTAA
ncbi:hypothetical protein L1I30_00830 [Gillisia sp. M10.2A]|uniref:Uncharacterized protein n=1 Tax=Gillisia lutea TaxID=2909668 RepID=A0ABS9EE78_9FLAO|nr:hypothetical protein [Gillisia lutea]MCF4100199.1 hypothetical protein [Gillisia lutea]